jgi:hypothetical protein
MKIQLDTQSKSAVKEFTQKIKETENKTWSGGCSTNPSNCKNFKTKANTPGPGVIAQWTGTRGRQEGSGFKVQTPVGKSLWPSVTELDLGVRTTCLVEGGWDAVAYGSNPLEECR